MAALPRRSLLALTAALSATAVVGCAKKSNETSSPQGSGSGGGDTKTLTVFLSGDTNMQELWEKALIPAFVKANPGYSVKVQLDLHGEHDAQTQAKITAANAQGKDPGMDLIDAGFVTTLADAGVMDSVDTTSIPNMAKVPEATIKAGKGAGIPYRGSSVLLVFDPEKVKTTPASLEELLTWVKANPGQFTYCPPKSGGSGGAFVTTVLDANMDAAASEKLRTDYDTEAMKGWSKGWEVLKGLNPAVYQKGVYPNGNKQALELLSGGQISMTTAWSDQFISGQKTGLVPAKMKSTQISDPSFTGSASYLGIPAASPRKEDAKKLANFVLSPECQNLIAQQIAGYPVIPLTDLPEETQKIFKEAHPDTLRSGYLDKVGKDMNNQWDQNVPGK